MAERSANVKLWIGEPKRMENQLCPECFTSAQIWVPYYTYVGDDPVGRDTKINAFRRILCMNCNRSENIAA